MMENPVGWLMRVATNFSLSNRRRSVRRVHTLPAPEPTADVQGDPALSAALATLTPSQRAAVVLRFYLDLSIEDTARTLGKRRARSERSPRRGSPGCASSWGTRGWRFAMNESLKDALSRAATRLVPPSRTWPRSSTAVGDVERDDVSRRESLRSSWRQRSHSRCMAFRGSAQVGSQRVPPRALRTE